MCYECDSRDDEASDPLLDELRVSEKKMLASQLNIINHCMNMEDITPHILSQLESIKKAWEAEEDVVKKGDLFLKALEVISVLDDIQVMDVTPEPTEDDTVKRLNKDNNRVK